MPLFLGEEEEEEKAEEEEEEKEEAGDLPSTELEEEAHGQEELEAPGKVRGECREELAHFFLAGAV